MNTSRGERNGPRAVRVKITKDAVAVDLVDGRTVIAPLGWYPRLLHGTTRERNHWRLIGRGDGVHWPDLDEDVSVEGLLDGRPSGESQRSFKRWLQTRTARRNNKRLQPALKARG